MLNRFLSFQTAILITQLGFFVEKIATCNKSSSAPKLLEPPHQDGSCSATGEIKGPTGACVCDTANHWLGTTSSCHCDSTNHYTQSAASCVCNANSYFVTSGDGSTCTCAVSSGFTSSGQGEAASCACSTLGGWTSAGGTSCTCDTSLGYVPYLSSCRLPSCVPYGGCSFLQSCAPGACYCHPPMVSDGFAGCVVACSPACTTGQYCTESFICCNTGQVYDANQTACVATNDISQVVKFYANDHAYNAITIEEARYLCTAAYYSNLVELPTASDITAFNNFLSKNVTNMGSRQIWLNLVAKNGNWYWNSDQTNPVMATNWAAGEPSASANGYCAYADHNRGDKWYAIPCGRSAGFIGSTVCRTSKTIFASATATFRFALTAGTASSLADADALCIAEGYTGIGTTTERIYLLPANLVLFVGGLEVNPNSQFWIGLQYSTSRNQWEWYNAPGTETSLTYWGPYSANAPNPNYTTNGCARATGTGGEWYNYPCSGATAYRALCRRFLH